MAVVACDGDPSRSAGPPWEGARLETELRVGVAEGAPELMFGSVRAVAGASDGRFYVADARPVVVRAFDADGNHLGDIGQEGQGPGEYGHVAGLTVLPDDRVVVWDAGNRRLLAFTSDGTLSWSTAAQSSFMHDALTADHDGNVHLLASEGSVRDPQSLRYLVRRFSAEGQQAGSTELPGAGPPIAGYAILDMIRMRVSNYQVGAIHRMSPLGYLVSGRNDAYAIELQDPSAPVVLARDVPPTSILPEERDEIERYVTWVEGRMASMGREVESDPLPEHKPYFRDIRIGGNGRVWLQRYATAELTEADAAASDQEQPLRLWREPEVFDVFEPDGTFLGQLRMPAGTTARTMRGDLVWATELDDNGVERVVRMRVVPAE